MPRPISADLPAEELIARLADPGRNDAWHAVQPWLADRDPLSAAREILTAAAVATPAQRIAAVEIVLELGEPAQTAWREASTVTNLAAHARMILADWSESAAQSPEDSAWLAVDYFGASWYHDVTREKVLDLDVGATYPVCVTGSGDFPIEYWTGEDDDQKSLPFDKDKINDRLAQLARHSNPV